MHNLANVELAITVSDSLEDPVQGDRFEEEFIKTIGILQNLNIIDIHLPYVRGVRNRENQTFTSWVEVSQGGIESETITYDENGDMDSEEVGTVLDNFSDEQTKLFEDIRNLFDPTGQPVLMAVWDKLWAIRIDPTEVTFSIDPGLPDEED